MPSPQTSYFVKQELQTASSHDYATAIETYTESHDTVTEDQHQQQREEQEEHPIDCQDEKLFLCNIAAFDTSKEIIDKEATNIVTHDSHRVHCPPDDTVMPTATLVTVNANGQLEERELIVKEDDTKCMETEMDEEYLNEQLLNESVDDNNADDEGLEEDRRDVPEQKRTLSRKVKAASTTKSYSEDEICDEDWLADDNEDSEEPKFKCNVCSKSYATQKGLKNHSQVHDKNHKCPTCHKLFYKLKNMENHKKIHAAKPHACQLCHASFTKAQGLVRHSKCHADKSSDEVAQGTNVEDPTTNEMSPTSKSDGETDDETGTNQSDDFDNPPGLYKCEVCGQFCSSPKNLKRHTLVHGDKKYSCTVCKKWFFRPDTLKKHAEKHGHGLLDNLAEDNKLFDSDDESFTNSGIPSASSVETEKKDDDVEAGGRGEYKCQHCDKVMATKKGLRRHVSMHKPKAEPVTCEICKKICASQARLALHLKTHNKSKEKIQREYLCHICSKVYPSNSSLTYHMRTHTGVKPHVCKICNSGFTTTTSLANHIRIHTGDKPFVCHVCSAAFAVSSAFRRHLTRHTGEANYLCKTCGKAFKRLSTLKEHTYTHSGEKPYVCKTCGAAYSHSGSLFAHQKRCRVQYGEMLEEQHTVAHHIHVNNVQTAVRSLAVIGQMY